MRTKFLMILLAVVIELAFANFVAGNGEPTHILNSPMPLPPLEKDVAFILKAVGQVQVSPASNGFWQNAGRGARLNAGNQLRTGNESLAAIVFTDDKSLLKVRSNSKVVINGKREASTSGARRIAKTIAMETGELWAKVTKGSSPFRVETPSGVAAVKGTVFYGILDANGNFLIVCLDGIVELINQFGSILVNAGETGISSPDQAPESHPTSPDELPTWADDEGGEMEIEFQDDNGQKKKLKIRYE
jgi:hypothetical protein